MYTVQNMETCKPSIDFEVTVQYIHTVCSDQLQLRDVTELTGDEILILCLKG
jgi:hypothetical protein